MGITAYQRQQRHQHLGSSDVAALFGLSKFQSAYDIWLEKTGQLKGDDGAKEWLQLGSEFEPVILARAEKELGPLRRNQYRSAKDRGLHLGSNIDAIVVESGRPVEAKTCGVFWPVEEVWGEPGTDQVPDRVLIQAHVHMICTDMDLCHVPVMQWGMKHEMYQVPRDEEMATQIKDYTTAWWDKHVIAGVAPEGTPSLAAIKRMVRQHKTVEVWEELIRKWRRAVKLATKVDKIKKAAQAAVLAALGDAEIGTCPLGVVTYLESARKGHIVPPRVSRVARWKENKMGVTVRSDEDGISTEDEQCV